MDIMAFLIHIFKNFYGLILQSLQLDYVLFFSLWVFFLRYVVLLKISWKFNMNFTDNNFLIENQYNSCAILMWFSRGHISKNKLKLKKQNIVKLKRGMKFKTVKKTKKKLCIKRDIFWRLKKAKSWKYLKLLLTISVKKDLNLKN